MMNGNEFIHKLKAYGQKQGIAVKSEKQSYLALNAII